MSPSLLASVAAGGAAGAVARYALVSLVGHYFHGPFPWGTLAVNVLGSFLMGVVVRASAVAWSPTPEVRAAIVVGVLGAFTTFSTFAMDTWFLVERHSMTAAAVYIGASVVCAVAGLVAGIGVVRLLPLS